MKTLSEALQATFEADKTLRFYDFSGVSQELSFGEFGERVRVLAEHYRERGVGPGVVVALMGPTSLDLSCHGAAVWLCGGTLTVLPMPTRLGNLELFLTETMEKLRRSRAALLVGDEGTVAVFADLLGIPVCGWSGLESLELDAPIVTEEFARGLALVQFSSGTTRAPEPILLSAEALLRNSRAVLDRFPGGAENHSCVSWLPLYHDMGLIGCFLMPLLAPGDLTLMGPEVFAVKPLAWLQAISEQRATTSSAPNFALAYCCDRVSDYELESLDLSCWEIAMVGAETVRPATLRRFAEKFAPCGFQARAFSPVYGLAEATLAVTFSPLGGGLKTLGYDRDAMASEGLFRPGDCESACLGRPLEGVEVEIRQDGQLAPEGRLGDVWVKSPSLLTGILEEEVRSPLKDGWLETGDTGFTVDGELYLYGRRRDILLLDGRNHDPSVVEEGAEGLDALRRCCAFCQEVSEKEKDLLVLICEVSKSWSGEVESLRGRIRNVVRKKSGLLPDCVVLVPAGELPVTSSGKLRRAETARMYAEGEFHPLEPVPV